MPQDPIVIVGAGVTGCVLSAVLSRQGHTVIVLEKEKCAGGLARTFKYGQFSFDIGPHRFFTHKKKIYQYILAALDSKYRLIPRSSEVYFLRRYYTWPLRPTALLNLPVNIAFRSLWDLIRMQRKGLHGKAAHFEEYILGQYGPSLYNAFFKEYTRKFVGVGPHEVHADWAKEGMRRTIIDERFASRDLADILKLFFTFKPAQTRFVYPEGGIGVFCDELIRRTQEFGGRIFYESSIKRINVSGRRIKSIETEGGIIHNPRFVVWTGNIKALAHLLEVSSEGVEYISLLLFNVELKEPLDKRFQWCYYGSKDVIFSRVTMPSMFSPASVPQGRESLCVEVTCRENDSLWHDPGSIIKQVKDDLMRVMLIKRSEDIAAMHIERIPDAYPFYSVSYHVVLSRLLSQLRLFDPLILAGRTGLFWYNNMDNSIENALDISDIIHHQY